MDRRRFFPALFIALLFFSCTQNNDRLIRELDNDDPGVRRHALTTLLFRGHDTATVKKLILLLDSDNERLAFLAAQILTTPADTLAIPALGRLSETAGSAVRNTAVQSLGLIGHHSAVPYLTKALDDSSAAVTTNALRMLALLETPEAADAVRGALKHRSADVRIEAANTLYGLREFPSANVRAADFIVLFADEYETVRYVAAQALGYPYPDSEDAAEALTGALDDPSGNVRFEAIGSLTTLHCTDAIPKMKKMHDYVSYKEQIAISNAIKEMTGEDFPAFRAGMKNN